MQRSNLSMQFLRAVSTQRLAILTSLLVFSSALWASGWEPIARSDKATVSFGGTVSVLDDGSTSVLDNDFDIESDPLTAFLTRGVKHGELTLEQDGTFVYRHDGRSKKDKDEFRYVAFDGTGVSRETKVTIKILEGDPIPPEITGQDTVEVDEDSSRTLRPDDLEVFDPDSNFPSDFSIEVGNGANYTRNGDTVSPVANFNGQLSVPVRVHDGTSFSNQYALLVDVRPRNDAPVVSGGPADQEAIEGTFFSLALSGYFSDIDDGDVLRFSASGLPRSNSLSINAVSGILAGTPARRDARDEPYTVSIKATDSGGASASLTFQLIIYPDDRADISVSATVIVNPVVVGESTRWSVDVFNKGPADLDEGSLTISWSTSGPALTISATQSCTITNNGTSTPAAACNIAGIVANNSLILEFEGTQDADGDNTLIAVAIADDPKPDDNSALAGSQVIELFSEGPTQVMNLAGAGVASGDFDGDGYVDIVVAADETFVFFNNGNRVLTTPGTVINTQSGGNVVTVLDWNGDTVPDIAVGGMAGITAEILVNDGSGVFSSVAQFNNGSIGNVTAMAASDLDLDGTAELILAGSGDTVILQRSGETSFKVILPPVGAGIDVAVGDINNDGFPDIAVVEASDRAVAVMINSGNGSNFNRTRERYGSVAHVSAADLNNDDLVDLLLAIDGSDLSAPENIVLYRQSGGGFSASSSFGASVISELIPGDVDEDGFTDILAINAAGVHQMYRGTSSGTFDLHEEQIVSAGMASGVMVDFNDDQSFDLIMVGNDALEVHANNGIGRLGLGDRRAPVITLLGQASITIDAGSPYEDAGATANDDIDGDLDASIVTTGSVNSTVVGTYNISYRVADRAGNTSTTQRTVVVNVNDGVGGGGGGAIGWLFLLGTLLLFASPIAAAQIQNELDELKSCGKLVDDNSRLQCYDEIGERLVDGQEAENASPPDESDLAAPVAVAATTSAVSADSTQLDNEIGGEKFEADQPEDVNNRGRITGCKKGPDTKWYFFFENGQAWKQVDDRRLSLDADCNMMATISKDIFGYKMEAEGLQGKIRISRKK